MLKTIIEPFRIKSVEPIGMLNPKSRRRLLDQAGYNVFHTLYRLP
jgi:tyrosine phenol-lyase